MRAIFRPYILFLVVCGLCLSASAIITGDNATAETNPFDATGLNWDYVYNYKDSSAVAVDPYWIVTAAHVADDLLSSNLVVGSTTYTQQEIVYHSSADLALVRYDQALPGYYDIYNGPLYVGDDVLMVGYGNTGTVSAVSYTDSGSGSGTPRWGNNEIDSAGWLDDTYVLVAGFSSSVTNNEAGVGVHDSGGGTFIDEDGVWKLVGINISRGPIDPPYNENYMASVPGYEPWISETIPEPAVALQSLCVLVGFGIVSRYRRLCQ